MQAGEQQGARVTVVVDREFGERLLSVHPEAPLWVIRSATNTPLVQQVWAEAKSSRTGCRVTEFVAEEPAPEDALVRVLGMVEEHHPDWSELTVVGAAASATLEKTLARYGFSRVEPNERGFTAFQDGD